MTEIALAGSPGYLALVGPASLRFQVPGKLVDKTSLPALSMRDPEPAITNAPSAQNPMLSGSSADNSPPATPASKSSPVPGDASTASANAPAVLLPTADPMQIQGVAPAITADQLVRFFVPVPMGTNSTAYVAPVVFSPPVPIPTAPVSRATYSTPSP